MKKGGGELIKMGWVQIAIFEILNLGPTVFFRSRIASGGSNPACLGKLSGNLLPFFPINRQKGVVLRIPEPLGYASQLFWVKKVVFVKKIHAKVLS